MAIFIEKLAINFKKTVVFVFKKLEFHPSYPSAFIISLKAEGYEG